VYPADYKSLEGSFRDRGLSRVSEGWVSRGKAIRYQSGHGEDFVFVEHETGPEIVFLMSASAIMGGLVAWIAQTLLEAIQKHDQTGERFYKAGAVGIESRTEAGGTRLVTVPLPVSGEELTIAMNDLVVKISRGSGHSAGIADRLFHMVQGAAPEPVKILFLGANPSDTTRLALTREAQSIDDRLRSSEYRDRFRVEQQWEVEAYQIPSKIMRFKPGIVHFSGHGSQHGELIFQDSTGRSQSADQDTIGRIFRLVGGTVRSVVLNACFSKNQALCIAKYVDTVIGMKSEIGDSDAVVFSSAFYEALGYGQDIGTAFELAKLSIDLTRLSDSEVPQLISREGVPLSSIRFVSV
jgi:hypothetical protein